MLWPGIRDPALPIVTKRNVDQMAPQIEQFDPLRLQKSYYDELHVNHDIFRTTGNIWIK